MADGYLTYGMGTCPHCRSAHSSECWLKETSASRFALLRYAAEMMGQGSLSKAQEDRLWTKLPTKETKLEALSSMRLGLPLVDSRTAKMGKDIRSRTVKAFAAFGSEKPITAMMLYEAVQPREYDSKGGDKGPLNLDKFKNVLSDLEQTGNIGSSGKGNEKTYFLEEKRRTPLLNDVVANQQGEFMLGILICPEKTFIAASGSGLNNANFKAAQTKVFTKYVICADRKKETVHKAISGKIIPPDTYVGCKVVGANDPGNCAAPRLLEQAFSDAQVDKKNFDKWSMSEIWYLPSTEKRTQTDMSWTHGITAESCATCSSLVPLLLCQA